MRVKYPRDRACARNTASSSSSSERKAIPRSTTIAAKCRARARRWNNHQRNVAVDGSGLARGVSLARDTTRCKTHPALPPRVREIFPARRRRRRRDATTTAAALTHAGGPRRRTGVSCATPPDASHRPFVRSSVRSTSWREVTRSTAFVELALR